MVQEQEFRDKTKMSFETFHEKYKNKLVWYLMRMCKDESTAQDVADDAFIKCLLDISKFNPELSAISTWTFTIAKNIMIQSIKKSQKFESIEEDHDGATIADFLQSNISENAEEKELILQKQINLLRVGIKELPEKYEKILTMRHVDCLSYDEIAIVSKLPLNTVKSRIRGGKQLLEKKLRKRMRQIVEMGV